MGQIKNIKLHIVTDIKFTKSVYQTNSIQTTKRPTNQHHDVQYLKDSSPSVEKCRSCVVQTTSCSTTSGSSNINSFGTFIFPAYICTLSWYRSCCQVHWSWSRHRRCCWIWCWYRNCLRKFDHWLCQKSIAKTSIVLLCHSWICFV